MKELSIEEKAKRYDEAIRESSKIINHCAGGANIPECVSVKATIEQIFPELKESEDEMIRKALLNEFIHLQSKGYKFAGLEGEEIIAWIEEQANHANFRNKIQVGDKVTKNEDGVLVNLSQLKRVAKKDEQNLANSAKTCKDEQKPAWSEEDEKGLGDALWAIQQAASIAKDENDMGNIWYAENWLKSLKDRVQPKQEWSEEIENCAREAEDNNCIILAKHIRQLKSLRPQNKWKPSDKQINCLSGEIAYKERWESSYSLKILKELLADLKKLKGE